MPVDRDRVLVSSAVGSAGTSSQDLTGLSIVTFEGNGVVISSNRGIFASADGGVTFSSLGSFGSSVYNTPHLQRVNSRTTQNVAVFKERLWNSAGSWRYSTITQSYSNDVLQRGSAGGAENIEPFRLALSERGKTPRGVSIDYLANVLSVFGVQWDDRTLSMYLRPLTKDNTQNRSFFIMNDLTMYAQNQRNARSGGTSSWWTEADVHAVHALLEGWNQGVYCTTLDGWHQRPFAQTAFMYVFETTSMRTWRVSADPNRADGPIGRAITGAWTNRNGLDVTWASDRRSIVNDTRTLRPIDVIDGNNDKAIAIRAAVNPRNAVGNERSTALTRAENIGTVNLADGSQVRHAMYNNKVYRWVKLGRNAVWQFDELESLGTSSVRRADLSAPAGGWNANTDTRFCVTPSGVMAVHFSTTECLVNYWNRGSDTWQGWNTVYSGRTAPPTGLFPTGAGVAASKSSSSEFVDIVALEGNNRGSTGANVRFSRYSVDAPPLQPVITAPDNGDILNSNNRIALAWSYSDPGGRGQRGIRVRRTVGTTVTYRDGNGQWTNSPNYVIPTNSQRIALGNWAPSAGNVTFEIAVQDDAGSFSPFSLPITVRADPVGRVTLRSLNLNGVFGWAYPIGAQVETYSYTVETPSGFVYESPIIQAASSSSQDIDITEVDEISGLESGQYTVTVQWTSRNGIQSPVATATTTITVPANSQITPTQAALRYMDNPASSQYGAVSVLVRYTIGSDLPNVGRVLVYKAQVDAVTNSEGEYYYIGVATPTGVQSAPYQYFDYFVASGQTYAYRIVTVTNRKILSSFVGGRVTPVLSTVHLDEVSDNDPEHRTLSVTQYVRGKESNIKSGVFADGTQRYMVGYEYLQVAHLVCRNDEEEIRLSLEQWLYDNQGKEFVLRLPNGLMERVLLGDVDISHRAEQGDTLLYIPLNLTVHRYPGEVRL